MSKKKNISFEASRMPQGSRHLYGNFYMVPFASIKTPDPDEANGTEYRFRNPRLLTERGQADLLDKKLCADLRDSIKTKTLLNPLVCRWVEEDGSFYPMIIGGDRRYRSLDFLIRRKETVVDPRSVSSGEQGDWFARTAPADEAYALVPCQIFMCNSDLDALSLAWAENKSRINLTEGHEIAEVIKLRDAKASDSKILEILQQDQKWLAETDRLIGSLDVNTLCDLLEGKLDRASAIELSAIEDIDVRDQIRNAANEQAAETCKKRIERLQNRMENALERQEIAETRVVLASSTEEVAEAEEQVNRARAEVQVVRRRRENVAPVTTTREVRQAAQEIAGEVPRPQGKRGPKGGPRKMRESKIKEAKEYFVSLIRNNGKCPEGAFTANLDALRLLVKIINDNILGNDPDWAGTLQRHYVAR